MLEDFAQAVPTVRIDEVSGRLSPTSDAATPDAATHFSLRYLAIADQLVSEMSDQVELAFCPTLMSNHTAPDRQILIEGHDDVELEQYSARRKHIVVVFGPSLLNTNPNDERLADIVAIDLSTIFQRTHPIACEGPIAKAMPWMMQIAGDIILPSPFHTAEHNTRTIESRMDRAIGRAIRGYVDHHYGNIPNAGGIAMTDFPALSPVAHAIAMEAGLLSASITASFSPRSAVYTLHEVIAQAMRNLGVPVSHSDERRLS